jgi:hypothetical protein
MGIVIGVMVIIAVLGKIIDRLIFSFMEVRVRRRWGLERA